MPTIQVIAELSVKQLLAAVKQLPADELHEFERQFEIWRSRNNGSKRKTAGKTDIEERLLIEQTRLSLPKSDQQRFKRLCARSERGTLTTAELAEYRALAKRAEAIDVKRAEALAKLAKRRGQSAGVVMKEIGWRAGSDET